MPKLTVSFEIKVPFYVDWYINSIVFFCKTFNTEPDYEKLNKFFNKHIEIVQCN